MKNWEKVKCFPEFCELLHPTIITEEGKEKQDRNPVGHKNRSQATRLELVSEWGRLWYSL